MKTLITLLVVGSLTAVSAGCQCCCITEKYGDVMDCVSDVDPAFDRLYHPELDVSRIGKRDWCRCPLNRCLCHGACDCP